MSDRCLKGCNRELAPIVHNLFQQSLDMHTYCVVLMGIILYCSHSKKPLSSQNNEYRLNSLVMKCLDRLLLGRVSMETSRFQDSHQHAYRRIKSTEDAILVHHDGKKHLDTPKTSVHVLFLDFSSAFNTIQPHTLPQKPCRACESIFAKWIWDFLTNRKMWDKINNTISTNITRRDVSVHQHNSQYTQVTKLTTLSVRTFFSNTLMIRAYSF